MVFDRRQAESVIERALELDRGETPAFDAAALQRLADELEVSPAAMSQAIEEAKSGRPGFLNAMAELAIDAPVSDVERAVESMLRLRGLHPVGSRVWRQDSGWWPDLYRFRAAAPVAVSVRPADGGTAVRLTARLDRIWRAQLTGAILGPLLFLLALAAGTGSLPTVLVAAVGWSCFSLWAYLPRRRAVERRLRSALTDLSRPAYRLQPW
jgi:hypothetical protein